MRIVFLGPPGAGKGTQAELISKKYAVPRIAPGDLFRKAVAEGSELGRAVKEYLDAGKLVPDEITVGLIKARISGDSARTGFVLDGFPRNLVQAQALEQMLGEVGLTLDAAVYISVPVDKLVERSAGRRVCSRCGAAYHVQFNPPRIEGVCDACGGQLYQRDDDRPETVVERLRVYEKDTAPLVEYYEKRGLLKRINGDQPVEKVFQDIQEALGLT